jgi:hypothetical protein
MSPHHDEPPVPTATAGQADPAWEEAFLRVENYLRAHHLASRVLLNHLTTEIIGEARRRVASDPASPPVAAALQVTHARIGAWFARTGHTGNWSNERVRAGARLALVLADVPGRWAQSFLSAAPVPPELARALASGVLESGPEMHASKMSAAPLEFGFDDQDDPHLHRPGGWRHLRDAAAWLAIVGLFGVAWAAAH